MKQTSTLNKILQKLQGKVSFTQGSQGDQENAHVANNRQYLKTMLMLHILYFTIS